MIVFCWYQWLTYRWPSLTSLLSSDCLWVCRWRTTGMMPVKMSSQLNLVNLQVDSQTTICCICAELLYPSTCWFIHLFMHPCIPTPIHPPTHMYVQASIHTCMHAFIQHQSIPYVHDIHHPLYTHKDILSSTVHPCIHAFIHSSVHPSISQFICLSLYLSVHPSIHPLIRSSLYLLIQLLPLSSSVHPSIHPIIRPSLCLSIHPSCYLPTHLLVQSNGDHTFYHARQTGWVIPTASWV